MGNRGRERLERCASCGRSVPRNKAVAFSKRTYYTTDLKGSNENVTAMAEHDVYYCISCAKHRKIFEIKKRMMQAKRDRGGF